MTLTFTQLEDLAIKCNQKGRHNCAMWLRTLAQSLRVTGAESLTLDAAGTQYLQSVKL